MSIGAALAVSLFAVYWFAYRVLPQTSGRITAPIEGGATVSRDSLGVPHIAAKSEQDALFLQGYVTAQDRLWQMDTLRRVAAGELAELFGRQALMSDQEARRMGLERIAEASYAALNPADRAVLAAYARGVNSYIETNRTRLPVEFSLLGYDPRPWSPVDSVLVALQMTRTLTMSWRLELQKQTMLAGGDAAKVNFLYPVRGGEEGQPGSNAWAISGARSASGRPILASDPHLEFSWPSAWYLAHLSAPGLNVAGGAIPGLPGIMIGHNDRIGWGVTNLKFDTQDLYIETFDPRTGVYLFRGRREQARPERDVIRVRGDKPVELLTWVTVHGPIFINEDGKYLAWKWVAAETSQFQYPFVELDRARNWNDFTAALARFAAPGANFVYADKDGNIGCHAAGKFPIRRKYAGDVPVDGNSGDYEWQGYIPFDQLPSTYNPPSGIVVAANQDPFPDNYPYPVTGDFPPAYRARQIFVRLNARKGWKPGEMLGVQTDVYSAFHHFLAREIVAAFDRRKASSPAIAGAIALLRNWNGQMRSGTAAPMIATLAFQHVRKAVAERASPGKGLAYDVEIAPAVIERLLRTRPPDWFADYDQLLLRSFVDALEEGGRIQGADPGKWDYGVYNQLVLAPPVLGKLPLVGKYFDIGPVPMNGSPTSVLQRLGYLGPSMRMVVDFSDWDQSLANLTLGQSGQVLSSHFKDQWDAYYAGRAFPMRFRSVEVKEVLVVGP